ncbi:rap1 GTPase-GDP dissociation stimulator 1-like [Gigantopelta aegis]|uniref:rap1 GTPase-GDP dissociation stimulator 1-like n=1 Tax=Gigantopelta aegis TaxID=1735272 RepID=UPI001B88C0CA|nr:rap1 GTPase-GDP dissociation stimulator 1-like [Gigantopelta aegis]
MDDLAPLVEKLKIAEDETDKTEHLDKLIGLLSQNEDDREDLTQTVINTGVLDSVHKFLVDSTNNDICSKCAQLLAELAKTESVRQPLVDLNFVPPLVDLLPSEDITVSTQACRALGNICFENDAARNAMDEADTMKNLLGLLRSQLHSEVDGAQRLRTIACGFLVNLTNTHEALQEKALEGNVLEILNTCLEKHLDDQGLTNMTLLTIASIADSDVGKEKISDSDIPLSLVSLLSRDEMSENDEAILDVLISLSDSDKMKEKLANTSLPNYLIRLIQTNTGRSAAESQQCVKMASDLLVSLLVGDNSMETLFAGGDGSVFIESVKWLDSDCDNLKIAGALAIGNFARSDEHCHHLVEDGITDKLLNIIKGNNSDTEEPNITLQHAVLSALRNLAIPVPNKPRLLRAGVMDIVLNLSNTEILAVAFKLLGVLRMLIDGQEEASKTLGCNKEFISRLVEWCGVEEHAGVKGEANRLLAWLVRNSKSADVMKNIIRADGLQFLVAMATSEHIVMQNEALFALTMICSSVLADAAVALKEADLSTMLTTILKDKNTVSEITCNTLTLTKAICTADNLREELISSGIAVIIRELSDHKDKKVRDLARSVLEFIDNLPDAR